jgi:hypothetical protein
LSFQSPKINTISVYRNRNKNQKGADMKNHLYNDVWLFRIVVAVLGLTVVGSVVGAILLALSGQSTPEVLVALGSAAIGGLAGLLAPSPFNR